MIRLARAVHLIGALLTNVVYSLVLVLNLQWMTEKGELGISRAMDRESRPAETAGPDRLERGGRPGGRRGLAPEVTAKFREQRPGADQGNAERGDFERSVLRCFEKHIFPVDGSHSPLQILCWRPESGRWRSRGWWSVQ